MPEMSEEDIDRMTVFGVRGSKRQAQAAERVDHNVDLNADLIQFKHFQKALPDTIQQMTKEEIDRQQKEQERMLEDGDVARIREQLRAEEERKKREDQKMRMDPQRIMREQQLVTKITSIFIVREISFYDAFKDVYDSLVKHNYISISAFKKYVKQLNLPLNV